MLPCTWRVKWWSKGKHPGYKLPQQYIRISAITETLQTYTEMTKLRIELFIVETSKFTNIIKIFGDTRRLYSAMRPAGLIKIIPLSPFQRNTASQRHIFWINPFPGLGGENEIRKWTRNVKKPQKPIVYPTFMRRCGALPSVTPQQFNKITTFGTAWIAIKYFNVDAINHDRSNRIFIKRWYAATGNPCHIRKYYRYNVAAHRCTISPKSDCYRRGFHHTVFLALNRIIMECAFQHWVASLWNIVIHIMKIDRWKPQG